MADGVRNGLNGISGKIRLADILISIFTTGVLVLNGWMLSSIVDLREFASKGDRFTMQDGQRLREAIVGDLTTRLPPRWLTDQVTFLTQEQVELAKRLAACENK